MGNGDLKYLSVPLPEDLEKLKWHGDFARMNRVLDGYLSRPIPAALRARLELEREIAARMAIDYPYDFEAALERMQAAVADFDAAELERLRDENSAEWAYMDGELRFKRNFMENVIKTRPEYAPRVLRPELLAYKQRNFAMLDEVILRMRRQGGMRCRIRLRESIRVKPEFERPGELIRVHLPLPVETAQVRDVKILQAAPTPGFIAPPDASQRTVYFEEKLRPGRVFSVEYEFTNEMRYVEPDAARVAAEQPVFCLSEESPHIVFTPYIRAATRELVGDEPNPLLRARRIYDYLTTQIRYSYVRSYLTIPNLPEYMLTSLKGDCGIFALTFITLCRCAGVPAEWQSGLYVPDFSADCHDWARFYVAPYGWLYADCSYGNAAHYAGSELRRNFYFGNLDPFRMPAAARFQQPFDPPKRFLRSDPYDNQNGEAEYADGPLYNRQLIDEQQTLEVTEL